MKSSEKYPLLYMKHIFKKKKEIVESKVFETANSCSCEK